MRYGRGIKIEARASFVDGAARIGEAGDRKGNLSWKAYRCAPKLVAPLALDRQNLIVDPTARGHRPSLKHPELPL